MYVEVFTHAALCFFHSNLETIYNGQGKLLWTSFCEQVNSEKGFELTPGDMAFSLRTNSTVLT